MGAKALKHTFSFAKKPLQTSSALHTRQHNSEHDLIYSLRNALHRPKEAVSENSVRSERGTYAHSDAAVFIYDTHL